MLSELIVIPSAKLLFPIEKGGLRDAHLSTDLFDTGAGICLTKSKSNMLFGAFRLFHSNDLLFVSRYSMPENSSLEWSRF